MIIELGSVTKASEKLGVTQPTLSRTLKILEDRVGGPVVRRERYGVAPTTIGRQLAEEGRAIVERTEQARAAVRSWRQGLSGELRLGVGPMLAASIMGDIITEMVADPPMFGLKLDCDVAARLVQRLQADRLDAAVIPMELSDTDEQFHRERLFSDTLTICVGAEDAHAGLTGVSPSAFTDYNWITISESSGLTDITRELVALAGLGGQSRWIENTGDVSMTFRMLERTRSCCVLPRMQAEMAKKRYDIATVDLDRPLPSRDVGLWTRREIQDRPDIAELLSRISTYLARNNLDQPRA